MRTWRLRLLIAFQFGLGLPSHSSLVSGFDLEYAIQDTVPIPGVRAAWNPDGATLAGVNRSWIIDGLPYTVCTDWNPIHPSISAALGDWENVLPGSNEFVPGFTCGTNAIRIQRASVTARPVGCADFAFACALWRLEPADAQRGGRYTRSESIVWVDDLRNGGDAFDDNGLRHLVAHELGHIFGLHEAYDHDPQYSAGSLKCRNDTEPSVMDFLTVNVPFGRVTGGCDALGPTPRDVRLIAGDAVTQGLYELVPPGAPTTIYHAGPDIAVRFRDDNAAEEGYGVIVQRWVNDWIFADSRFLTNTIAPCTAMPCDQERIVRYRKPAELADGSYRLCLYQTSKLYPNNEAVCAANSRFLRSDLAHDTDGDGFSDRSEAGAPLCQDGANADPLDEPPKTEPEDAFIDDGCPAYGGLKELECGNSLSDDPASDDLIVNDGCEKVGAQSEGSFNIGTDPGGVCSLSSIHDPWPLDMDQDRFSDISDVSQVTAQFGKHVSEAPRQNIWPEPIDAYVDVSDLSLMTGSFGAACTDVPGVIPISFAEGTYVGDGSSSQPITDLGFSPTFVAVRGDEPTVPDSWWAFKWQGMPATRTGVSGESPSDGILSFDSNGFTVKHETFSGQYAKTNKTGVTYYWYAMSGAMKFGQYAGNGINSRPITGVGFQPVMVWIIADIGHVLSMKTSAMPDPESFAYTNSNPKKNRIVGLNGDGFTLGNDPGVNSIGGNYWYVAWKDSPNFAVGTFPGNDTDNTVRPTVPLSFNPSLVLVQHDSAGQPYVKTLSVPGEISLGQQGVGIDNRVQSLNIAPGQFQIGWNSSFSSEFNDSSYPGFPVVDHYFFAIGGGP